MLTLDLITRATQDLNLVVTNVNREIQTDMIPGLDPTETVDIYYISEYRENMFTVPRIDILLAESSTGAVYLLFILATTRLPYKMYFLDSMQHEHYIRNLLPLYNVHATPKWVKHPCQFTSLQGAKEFYYIHQLEHVNMLNGSEINENILRDSLQEIVYWGGMYASVVSSLFDVATNEWVRTVKEYVALDTPQSRVTRVSNGVAWINNRHYESGICYYNGRYYYGFSNPTRPDPRSRCIITPENEASNNAALAPFMDLWDRHGLDVTVGILSEKDSGPYRNIAKMMMEFSNIEYDQNAYDIMFFEITPRDQLNAAAALNAFYAVIASKRWTSTNLEFTARNQLPNLNGVEMLEIPEGSTPEQFLRQLGEAITSATGLELDMSAFDSKKAESTPTKAEKPKSKQTTNIDDMDFFMPTGKSS